MPDFVHLHNHGTHSKFWAQVKKTKTCWLWTGNIATVGYGRIRLGSKREYVHRFAWELYHKRKVPVEKLILHKNICSHKHCVKDSHIYAGTVKQNFNDMVNAGKHWSPYQNGLKRNEMLKNRKLSWPKILRLKCDYRKGFNQLQLSRKYKIGAQAVTAALYA